VWAHLVYSTVVLIEAMCQRRNEECKCLKALGHPVHSSVVLVKVFSKVLEEAASLYSNNPANSNPGSHKALISSNLGSHEVSSSRNPGAHKVFISSNRCNKDHNNSNRGISSPRATVNTQLGSISNNNSNRGISSPRATANTQLGSISKE
jgi:hypothetical protein